MNIVITKNYQEMSQKVAKIFLNQLALKPNSVFGLATGSTPLGMYTEIIKEFKTHTYDFSRVVTFNLDEYYDLKKTHEQSYYYFMRENLFNYINVKKNNINVPDGTVKDIEKYCEKYESKIKQHPIDLQILGIGGNGHIGFNEPGSLLNSETRLVDLKEETIADNARFFKNKKDVPTQAITMGIDIIMQSKKIIVLASGQNKAKAVRDMIEKPASAKCPASWLQKHNQVIVIIDEEAASLLKKKYKSQNTFDDVIYNENNIPKNKNVLVISPHNDDSAVSCGATIKGLSRKNKVYSLLMTSGHHALIEGKTKAQKIQIRKKEAIAEGRVLGSQVIVGNFKFYEHKKKFWQDDLKKLKIVWQKIKPEIILLPHPHDEHPTHVLSTELILDLIKKENLKNIELWYYEGLWSQHILNTINIVFGFNQKLLEIKNKALKKHISQVERLPLIKASQALAKFRATTLPEQHFVGYGAHPPHIADFIESYYRVIFS